MVTFAEGCASASFLSASLLTCCGILSAFLKSILQGAAAFVFGVSGRYSLLKVVRALAKDQLFVPIKHSDLQYESKL